MNAPPNFARAAFRLAMRGLRVLPLVPGAKFPMKGIHGCRSATRDPDVVRAWWAKWPSANIGIATGARSGLWVLDIDPRHGGVVALAALESDHGPLPATITASTPRGGRHHYWRWPTDGPEIRNSGARVGDGLDVLGEGGSVVAPPSIRALGGRYAWCDTGAALADAPVWLVDLTRPPAPPTPRRSPYPGAVQGDTERYVAAAAAAELQDLESAPEGTRNHALNRASFSLAGFVKAGALPEDWARGQLEQRAIGIGL
ncbi:MAG: bifunctional DNA primase/polymerase, partial [Alphaproteobacteria bacterium]|nr:bifunctional DNA primase/polymerase [Alphaproteobacteria bacterium]